MNRCLGKGLGLLLFAMLVLLPLLAVTDDANAATTTSLTIKKLASDGKTVLAEETVDYTWLMDNVKVMGDGETHYYHQGPVFIDADDEATEEELRWNEAEDTNVEEKDMGAVMGTNVKDLCKLVGGMSDGETIKIKSIDGLSKTFAYKNVYQYSKKEGPMVICWYKDGEYPDTGYSDGMRLVWFADDSTNPWGYHVFGNWNWYEAADEEYWYYYKSDGESYPTTTGLSIQNVSELIIYSNDDTDDDSDNDSSSNTNNDTESDTDDDVPIAPVANFSANKTSGYAPLTVNFTNQSENSPKSWEWDFDNNGTVDSTDKNPTYTYNTAGKYSVKLKVTNKAGSDEELKTDFIIVTNWVKVNINDIAGHWAKDNIEELINLRAISGYQDNSFKPNDKITRAEFVTVLVKAFNLYSQTGQVFTDTANHWAKDYIATAAALGIVSGYDANTFAPDDFITREEMAAMVVKASGLGITEIGTTFSDSGNISVWAKSYVTTAYNAWLIRGYPDNTYRPQGNASRAEAATIILKAYNKLFG